MGGWKLYVPLWHYFIKHYSDGTGTISEWKNTQIYCNVNWIEAVDIINKNFAHSLLFFANCVTSIGVFPYFKYFLIISFQIICVFFSFSLLLPPILSYLQFSCILFKSPSIQLSGLNVSVFSINRQVFSYACVPYLLPFWLLPLSILSRLHVFLLFCFCCPKFCSHAYVRTRPCTVLVYTDFSGLWNLVLV